MISARILYARYWRLAALRVAELQCARYRDQLELEVSPDMSPEDHLECVRYAEELRDWPNSPSFPETPPVSAVVLVPVFSPPAFIVET